MIQKNKFILIAVLVFFIPLICWADELSPLQLPNFLKFSSFEALITALINAVNPVIMALAVFFLILSGFQFLTAQGEPSKIKAAQETFKWTAIGVAVVVGAELIIRVLKDILQTL